MTYSLEICKLLSKAIFLLFDKLTIITSWHLRVYTQLNNLISFWLLSEEQALGGYLSFLFYFSTNLKYIWWEGALTENLLDYLCSNIAGGSWFLDRGFFSHFTLSSACLPNPITFLFVLGLKSISSSNPSLPGSRGWTVEAWWPFCLQGKYCWVELHVGMLKNG